MFLLHLFSQVLVFLPFALGVYLSFGILRTPDLTVDGSFVLGAGVFAKLLVCGVPASVAIVASVVAGGVAGLGVALLQRKGRVSPLIAGILGLFVLQSVNLLVMGMPNISLLGMSTVLSYFGTIIPGGQLLFLLALGALLLGGSSLLVRSKMGLRMRAFGSSPTLLSLFGRSPERARTMGLVVSNGLVALSGVLTAQLTGFADVGMGAGLILVGLAAVIIGQQLGRLLFKKDSGIAIRELLLTVVGVVIYFLALNYLVAIGINPIVLKMAIGLGLAGFLVVSRTKKHAAEALLCPRF